MKWCMARAQLSSQSMGVLRFGPCDGAMTLPSGPMAGSRSGRETLVSAAVAPSGGSSPPLRPQPARPSAAMSAPIAPIRARRRSDRDVNSGTPQIDGTIADRTREATAWPNSVAGVNGSVSSPFCQGLKPPVGLPAHVLRGRASIAAAALHRVVDGEHRKHVLGDALLDCLHGGERQLMEQHVLRRRLGHDPPSDVMRLAERHLMR